MLAGTPCLVGAAHRDCACANGIDTTSGEGSQFCEEIYFCVFGNVLEGGIVYTELMADQPDLLMSLLESLFADAPGSSGSFESLSRFSLSVAQ